MQWWDKVKAMKWWKSVRAKMDLNWSALRKLQDQRVVKSMYLWLFVVPLLANALQHLPPAISVSLGASEFDFITTLPFSWTMFYVSALFFVSGHLVFFAYCPALIREHTGLTHFLKEGKSAKELWEYAEQAQLSWESLRNNADVSTPPVNGETPEERFKRIFWETYKGADRYCPRARLASSLFYLLGILAIGWVIVTNSITVFHIGIRG